MKLTTKGRFAVTAMVDLALHDVNAPISLVQISERQHISVAYLEQIFCKLRRAGLVLSVRGPGGGYRLKEPADAVSVASIVDAVEEDLDATQCHGDGTCSGGAACLTHHLWEELNAITQTFLDSVTLQDIVLSQHRMHAGEGRRPRIAVVPVKSQDRAGSVPDGEKY